MAKLGNLNIRHGGRFVSVDENATGDQLRRILGTGDASHLVAPDGREIPSAGRVRDYIHDGDPVAARPEFEYW